MDAAARQRAISAMAQVLQQMGIPNAEQASRVAAVLVDKAAAERGDDSRG
jgi:hypothetical protein